MSDSRFEGITLHVGWWGDQPFRVVKYVPRLDSLSHPTEWTNIVAVGAKPGDHIWCNQPLVVDAFPPSRVRVWSKSGKSKLLSEHPEAAKWSGVMESGELWTHVGEAWVDQEDGGGQ